MSDRHRGRFHRERKRKRPDRKEESVEWRGKCAFLKLARKVSRTPGISAENRPFSVPPGAHDLFVKRRKHGLKIVGPEKAPIPCELRQTPQQHNNSWNQNA